ncbi:MAG: hypothetical protein ABSB75_08590, partial [Candidatus Limnocylindrales bacterium]
AHGFDSDAAEEQVALMVHGAARDILGRVFGMLEESDFLPLQGGGIEPPDDPFALGPVGRYGMVNRVSPPRGHVIQLAVTPEDQTAAMVHESVSREAGVALLGGGAQVLDAIRTASRGLLPW